MIEEYRESMHRGLITRKEPRYVDPLFTEYIRENSECIKSICTYRGPLQMHHVIFKSEGNKASDAFQVAVCPDCHHEIHNVLGPEKFEATYGVSFVRQVVLNIERYMAYVQDQLIIATPAKIKLERQKAKSKKKNREPFTRSAAGDRERFYTTNFENEEFANRMEERG